MIKFKPGDTISWAGLITLGSVSDFSGYSLACHFKALNKEDATLSAPLAEAAVTWLDATKGRFLVVVPKEDTESWPAPATIMMDVVLISPSGDVVTTETAQFETVERITELT